MLLVSAFGGNPKPPKMYSAAAEIIQQSISIYEFYSRKYLFSLLDKNRLIDWLRNQALYRLFRLTNTFYRAASLLRIEFIKFDDTKTQFF